ncbi:MAG: hypothetical protein GWP12_03860 [Nitrospirae bacterium]|nr:hypothetical protein [Nitrospirota bacterium]
MTKKRLLSLKPRPGNATLANTALKLVKELVNRVKPRSVRLIMDAGGCKGSVIARLSKIKDLTYLVRGKRQPKQTKQWKEIPEEEYKEYPDPGDQRRRSFSQIRGQK